MPAPEEPRSGFGYTEDSPLLVGAPIGGGVVDDLYATEVAFEPAIASARLEPLPAAVGRRWYQGLGYGFWLASAYCVLWILIAIFAGVLPLPNPTAIVTSCIGSYGPSTSHWLGCDAVGRDTLSRVIFGSRVSLVVGFASIAIGLVVGGALGLLAGYFRGWIDELLTIITNTFLSFPSLVLGLLIVDFLGHSLFDITLIIAIVAWPLLFRVVRAATIEYSQREYVLAARALGAKPSRILLTLLLPDVVPSAITYGLLGVALAIIGEGALSFLGQSVPTSTPTWGNMIAGGSSSITLTAWPVIFPALAMFLFILAINFMGDRLRSVLDVRQGVL